MRAHEGKKLMLGIIPARGGSKGIPRKNLLHVGGKPLIAWTIEQALQVEGLKVFVSTEDDEIAETALSFGAGVIQRPTELAKDTTPTEPVVLHALDTYASSTGADPDTVMLLQATSPLRLPGTLQRAVDEFRSREIDSSVGVVPNPPFLWGGNSDEAVAFWDVANRPRRQDLTPAQLRYRETGSVYITASWVYRQLGNRLGGRMGLFVMDEREGIDIDTLHDLGIAEASLTSMH